MGNGRQCTLSDRLAYKPRGVSIARALAVFIHLHKRPRCRDKAAHTSFRLRSFPRKGRALYEHSRIVTPSTRAVKHLSMPRQVVGECRIIATLNFTCLSVRLGGKVTFLKFDEFQSDDRERHHCSKNILEHFRSGQRRHLVPRLYKECWEILAS